MLKWMISESEVTYVTRALRRGRASKDALYSRLQSAYLIHSYDLGKSKKLPIKGKPIE